MTSYHIVDDFIRRAFLTRYVVHKTNRKTVVKRSHLNSNKKERNVLYLTQNKHISTINNHVLPKTIQLAGVVNFVFNYRFHGDVTRRVTLLSGTTGWQKILGWRAPRVFCLDSCLVYINFAHTQYHDYALYLCGVPLALCGRLVLVCYHPKKGKTKRTYQPSFVDISYHPVFIATHINISYITESTTTGCILCCKRNKRPLPSTA